MDNRKSGYGKSQLETSTAQGENALKVDEMNYQQSVRVIGKELQKAKQSSIKIGWHLKYIKDRELYGRERYSKYI